MLPSLHALTSALAIAVIGAAIAPPQGPDAQVRRVVESQAYKDAAAALDRLHDQLIAETIRLTEIPAPPFHEAARARAVESLFRQAGLADVAIDGEGNVTGIRKGAGTGPLVAMAAHLDTVFPEGTDVHVKRAGTKLSAPGIGDDTRSIAVLLALVRAMAAARVRTASDILFVADVGEEGAGDLRGMKYLFQKGPYKDRIKMFVSVDGTGPGSEITNGAVGSKRYRVTFKGPGGHSYGAFGLVSPAFALGAAIDRISRVSVPSSPKTTFNVGVVGGGTSVNSIPGDAWMDLDLRSESRIELDRLDKTVAGLIAQAADAENRVRSTAQGRIIVDTKLIGERPSGETAPASPFASMVAGAIAAMGMTPHFNYSSTDSNIPISLGIPAVTLDSGATGGREHSLDEWIDVEKTASLAGVRTILLILLTAAGAE